MKNGKSLLDIIGNVTADSELNTTPAGAQVLNFSVAVNREKNGEKQVNYYRCAIWGARGVALQPFILKGILINVTGKFWMRPWTPDNGECEKISAEIDATEIILLPSGKRETFAEAEEEEVTF